MEKVFSLKERLLGGSTAERSKHYILGDAKPAGFHLEVKEDAAVYQAASAGDLSAEQMINFLLSMALSRDASDIHLEPTEKGLRVRLRVDGILNNLDTYTREMGSLVISRLKILAGMDIAEKRLPQDGNIPVMWAALPVNVRLSTLPTIRGEKMVIRLLRPDKIVIPLNTLGFKEEKYCSYLRFLRHTHGMILVTGPAGCGKTTTLYSTLYHLNQPGRNVITIEDPVEYRLAGVNQVQVNNKIKLTFARALRHILRQDPDIIMIGEIRDNETAEIATRAALTGHQLFSTLHTNDAPGAVTRLLDMGVEPFLLASALVGVVAQRLFRLTCNHCREEYTPSTEELAFYEEQSGSSAGDTLFTRGKGCEQCHFTGYLGRTAMHEIMPVDETMRKLILKAGGTEEIRRYAVNQGMQTLLKDGLSRVKEGLTTLQEVLQVAYTVC
ncbi:MAG: type II/IV secretion system protein [Firmicutes bacterium]|nr:type II/IV secretion system protein [Bacillota bacterium]